MKITAIKQQVKQAARYSIFVDDKYSFSLSELALINSGLRVGQELSAAELKKLKEESSFDKAYNRVLGLLARRQRSVGEIRDYLWRKKEDPKTTEKILNKLIKSELVNDRKFAEAWVANRHLLKPTSQRRLRQELRQKHVADEIIDEVLTNDQSGDRQALEELIQKKRQQSRYKDETKLMQYLARQGYNYGDIKNALSGSED